MAVLGVGGRIVIKRTAPPPEVLNTAAINAVHRVYAPTQKGYRAGDLVEIASLTNWPNASTSSPVLVPAYTAEIPPDWRGNLELVDYTDPYPTGLTGTIYKNQLYIGIDQHGNISFYRNRASALRNTRADREDLSGIADNDAMEFRLVNDWRLECGLTEWSLNMTADILETTNLGEVFFNGVKNRVSGAGQFDFIVEREFYEPKNGTIISIPNYQNAVLWTGSTQLTTYIDASITDNTPDTTGNYTNAQVVGAEPVPAKYQLMARAGTSNLMRLLFAAEDQAEADAEFWLIPGETSRGAYTDRILEPGDLFYRAKILINATAISTVATDIITGSASFVTVQTVELLEGVA